MTDRTDSKEREAFEAWCVTQGWVEKPSARPNGTYINGALQARWLGWIGRASLAASAGSEPVPDRAFLERTLSAMEGVIDVADRKTAEFDALRSCVIDLTLMLFKAAPIPKTAAPTNWPTNEMLEAGRKAAASHGPLLGNGQSLWHVFRDMFAAASAGGEPVAPYAIDADPLGIRSTVADAITGALAFGAQGVNPPPEGHWLEPFWNAAKADRALQSSAGDVPHGWLYSWTHSSATGRPDEDYTAFTQDEQYARNGVGHRDVIAVYTHPSPPEGMVGGWQDIATAPKDGTSIIAYRPSSPPHIECMNWCEYADADIPGAWHWAYDGDAPRENPPTHWIPLPPSPTSSADSGKGGEHV